MTQQAETFSDDFLRDVGAVVVAGGQVEAQLQALLLHLGARREPPPAEVRSMTWGPLVNAISRLAPSVPDADAIVAELQRADGEQLAGLRHQMVHAHWLSDRRATRWPRGDQGGFMMIPPAGQIEAIALEIHEFAVRLMNLLPPPVPAAPHIRRLPLTSVRRPDTDR